MFSNGFATGAIAFLMAGAQLASAHMEIQEPAPFRSKFNPHATNIDYTNTAPLSADGANYPCKGYHSDLGTAAGAPTASYRPGGSYQFKVVGGANHGGGSCQVSLSYDKGATFTVIQSIIGGCPLASSYPFTIPDDAPEGEAIWAWSWNNNIGNREFYMNCAPITISKSAAKREIEAPKAAVEKRASVGFTSRPALFVANIANGCNVAEGTDVAYPNPGPDVVNNGGKTGPPSGNCGPAGAPAPNPGNGGGDAPAPTTEPAPVVPPTTAAPEPTKPVSLPGGVFITVPNPNKPVTSSAAVEAPAPEPTTLIVSTRPADTPTAAPAPVPTGGSGQPLGYPAGKACENEGSWNCLGDFFQRCASGTWSVLQPVAAGTTCQLGEGTDIAFNKRAARRSFRWRQGSRLQLA
ncbi:hypothetical protein QBC40DRAFT_39938 [Triangularia verruculosa]|uniref:Extracellular protein n=1 Tax=Triangularia verruculosa TaxID=2587418 RepID=A0AAN7APD8_9PEZI|nr:hypothetical protein QBC40DRAFT_39938 [Triangularia verruculosa]